MSDSAASFSTPVISADLSSRSHARSEHHRFALPLALLIFLLAWALTGAHFMADTSVYTSAILTHEHGLPADDYHRLTANPFWEFGHVLWRPLGWILHAVFSPLINAFHVSDRVGVLWSLITLDFLASLACIVFFFLLAREIVQDQLSALLSTLLFCFSDAFLNYSHTGNAYPVGLACLVAGMYFSVAGPAAKPHWIRAGIAGAMFALAVLFWFPYLFVLPASFGIRWLCSGRDRDRLRFTGVVIAVCAATGITVYAAAIVFVGIRNAVDLRAWILAAGHGQIQAEGVRAIARLAFSMPRSFINMGNDGMLLKRYLVHDPYAPERLVDLIRLSLWKVGIFYSAWIVACVYLLRSDRGRVLLVLLAIAAVPVILFSLYLFEAGSIERYLPLYPFFLLAWGYALSEQQAGILAKAILMALLVCTIIVNLTAINRYALEKLKMAERERLQALAPSFTPASLILAVNEQDSVAEFFHEFPLDSMNSTYQWHYYDVLEINAARLSTWRRDLAARILWSWRHGGKVWVPRRLLHLTPDPKWNWVEGDDPRVHWSDLPAFFSRFNLGPSAGGDDGFSCLVDDSTNEQIVNAILRTKSSE